MDYAAWLEGLGKPVTRSLQKTSEYLPNLFGAAALLLVGWVLARLLRHWSVRVIGRLHWFVRSRAVQSGLQRIGIERPASELIGSLVFWIVFFLFLTAATDTLGLPILATWLTGLSYYLPRVLVAALIVFAGLLAGNVVRDAITTATTAAHIAYGDFLGRSAQVIILLISVVIAIDQVGIDSTFLTAMITMVIGAIVGGAALAFGLGARTAVSNIIASHYLLQTYQVGSVVKIGDVQGRILEITPTGVVLDTSNGRVLVPAKDFSEKVSVLLGDGG